MTPKTERPAHGGLDRQSQRLAKATTVALWFALAHNLMQITGG